MWIENCYSIACAEPVHTKKCSANVGKTFCFSLKRIGGRETITTFVFQHFSVKTFLFLIILQVLNKNNNTQRRRKNQKEDRTAAYHPLVA